MPLRTLPLAGLLAAVALVGCGKKDPDSGGETTVGVPGGTTTGTTSTTERGRKITLEEGPVVTCADPAARMTGFYERRTIPHSAATGSYTWGGGVIVEDFDGDGVLDIVVATGDGLQLVKTTPGTTAAEYSFDEDPTAFGSLDLSFAVGGTAADIDADGDMDLVLSRWDQPNALLLNDGSARFTDGTPASWQANHNKTQSASLADFDDDGDLDVFFGSSGDQPADPNNPPPADPAELYKNAAGAWEDVSNMLPREVHDGYTTSSGWWNIWGTPHPELIVVNDFGKHYPTVVARNGAGNSFAADTDFHPNTDDRSLAVADANGDAQPDFLLPSTGAISVLASGIAYGQPGFYQEVADTWSIAPDTETGNQLYSWGSAWGDLDNDADLDAMVAYGFWSDRPEAEDPLAQPDALFEQTGLLAFSQTAAEGKWSTADTSRVRGVVLADLNEDGYLDVIKGHPEADTALYLSRCGAQSWVRVRLQQNGSNPSAVGARVQLMTGSLTQTAWIQAGSSGMYAGAPLEAHFGTGARDFIDELVVTWPDGKESRFEAINGRKRVTITRTNAP